MVNEAERPATCPPFGDERCAADELGTLCARMITASTSAIAHISEQNAALVARQLTNDTAFALPAWRPR